MKILCKALRPYLDRIDEFSTIQSHIVLKNMSATTFGRQII